MHVPPEKLRPATRVIHAHQHFEETTGAVMPPIFTSSTYAQESPGVHKGFDYARSHNPTRYAAERLIGGLEGSPITEDQDPSCGGFVFSSGMAAMATALELCDAGAHVISMDDVYGGTNRQFTKVRTRSQGLKVSFIDLTDVHRFEAAMKPDTAMVWIESPTNPTLKLVDLAAVSRIAHRVNPRCLVVCDNTFASPINQRPLEHGCDIVLHSCTKYLNGHSDVVAGALVVKDLELCKRVRFLQNSVGSILGPFDSYLVLRGIKTLDVRMQRHNESGMKIAKWLEQHKGVERVVYPALASHPQHGVYQKQMMGASGMITFFLKGGLEEARRFLEACRVFALAESLGGVESLVDHPAIMTHASVPAEQRAALGISDSLIRLSVGVEDVQDLMDDLERALRAAATQAASARV